MRQLSELLGHAFSDPALLETALTHSSYANERQDVRSNERLEFLGDAVLGFCTAAELCRLYPDMPEGEMTRLRAELVCEAGLHRAAKRLGLRDHIRLGRNELGSGGRERVSILADCVEAIIAALYLDGGLEAAKQFIDAYILDGLEAGRRPERTDFKTQLQELLQREGGSTPAYEIIDESGPDHDKTFTARVSLPGGRHADGVGKSKKEAEQEAARRALLTFSPKEK